MYHSQAEREALARDATLADLRHAAAIGQLAPPTLCQRAPDALNHEREAVTRLFARLDALHDQVAAFIAITREQREDAGKVHAETVGRITGNLEVIMRADAPGRWPTGFGHRRK